MAEIESNLRLSLSETCGYTLMYIHCIHCQVFVIHCLYINLPALNRTAAGVFCITKEIRSVNVKGPECTVDTQLYICVCCGISVIHCIRSSKICHIQLDLQNLILAVRKLLSYSCT